MVLTAWSKFGLNTLEFIEVWSNYFLPFLFQLKGKEVELDNDLKPLQFYSIENGDSVLVRW